MSLADFAAEKAQEDTDKALRKHTVDKLSDPTYTWEETLGSDGYLEIVAPAPSTQHIDLGDWVKSKVVEKSYNAQVKLAGVPHTLTAKQQTITYEPPTRLVMPAPYPWPTSTPSAPVGASSKRLWAILPDQQAPYVNWELHELVLAWLRQNKPDGLVLTGDLIDFPSLSTFEWDPEMDPDPINSAQLGVDTAVRLMTDYAEAAGPQCAVKVLLEGNHELRWRKYLARHAPAVYGIRVPGEDEPLLSLSKLLRCKELGYQYIQGYPDAHYLITAKLAAYHGWYANAKSGVTALQTLDALDMSTFVGHTHRQSVVFKTSNPASGPREHVACEAGCLCVKSPGAKDTANWQRGFATVVTYADDTHSPPELATFTNGRVRWRDQQYWVEDGVVKISA